MERRVMKGCARIICNCRDAQRRRLNAPISRRTERNRHERAAENAFFPADNGNGKAPPPVPLWRKIVETLYEAVPHIFIGDSFVYRAPSAPIRPGDAFAGRSARPRRARPVGICYCVTRALSARAFCFSSLFHAVLVVFLLAQDPAPCKLKITEVALSVWLLLSSWLRKESRNWKYTRSPRFFSDDSLVSPCSVLSLIDLDDDKSFFSSPFGAIN